MQTGKSTIKTIFDGTRIFNIPIYQRAYSWDKDNLTDFLTDLVNQYKDRKYFLGSFLFHINGKRNDFAIVDVVDGQQRLTTFIIFMLVLIKELSMKNSTFISPRAQRIFIKDDDVFKIELSNEDSSFLHNYILSENAFENINPKTPSQTLLYEAKFFFTKELRKYEIDILEKLYTTSTEAEVLLYVVEEMNTATQIFELLNDRGKPLTHLEAIKSFLMYNIGLVSKNPEQLIKNIQLNFGEIYRFIEKYDINEEDVLRYHTIAFEGSSDDAKKFIKSKVLSLVKEDKSQMAIDLITSYAIRLRESFELFVQIQELKFKHPGLSKLFMIGRVAPFYPVLMRIKKESESLFDELLQNLNDFTFRAQLIGLRSNAESQITPALKHNSPSEVVAFIKGITQHSWWNINLRSRESLEQNIIYGNISTNVIKLILFTYENHLRKKKGFPLLGYNEYFSSDEREKLSIEHITAQRAKGLVFDYDFEVSYLHSFGNLVIDCKGSNSSKGNANTLDKMSAFNNAPLMSQNELDEIDCDWSNIQSVKNFIDTRAITIKEFIKSEFGLEYYLSQKSTAPIEFDLEL